MKPPKHILSPDFKYVPAKQMGPDYLRRKFEAIRQQQAQQASPDKFLPMRKR